MLRDGVAIDAEVPDYSELDTVPNERRYTADQPSAVPSEPPSMPHAESRDDVPNSVPDLTNGAESAAASVNGKVWCCLCCARHVRVLDTAFCRSSDSTLQQIAFQVAPTFLTLMCSS